MDLNFYQTIPSPYLEILAAVLGLAIGSYLNVLALRTLKEESIWRKRSYCPQCDHALGMLELIPLVSYFAQGGKCKHCHKTIHWQYPLTEAATAIIFAAIVHFLAPTFWSGANIDPLSICLSVLAMLYFAATLVAITITDFREKLIPHEITYPAILLGIIYSATVRHDLLGTLAGVGASYLIFDFIDHFGIKFYYFLHPEFRDRHKIEDESALDDQIDFDMEVGYLRADEEDEPFMVMGGGDAVLSALIAAWLGWERLIPALVIGFLMGAVMGGIYLLVELKKEKMLSGALKSFGLWFGGFAGAMALGIFALSFNFPQAALWNNPVTYLLIFALGFGGGTLGIMSAPGPRLVKHFPFGPALAIGALCSIFLIVGNGESFIKPY